MKVLFISNFFPPNVIGGYEQLCADVAAAFTRIGAEVEVLTSAYGGRLPEGAEPHPVDRSLQAFATPGNIYQPFAATPKQRREMALRNARALEARLAKFQPDAVFAWNLSFLDHEFIEQVNRIGSAPVLYFLTDTWLLAMLDPELNTRFFQRCVHGGEAYAVLEDPARPVRRIPVISIFGAAFMQRLYERASIRFREEIVVHNGVHIPRLPLSRYVDRLVPTRPRRLNLLFAGRVVDAKGPHIAVDALPAIVAACPDHDVTLTILGDGQETAYLARLHAQIAAAGMGARVIFQPQIAPGQLFDLFQAHDIYLFPSLHEPFSLTLILALQAGIPTVASDAGGNPEIVEDGQTGLLYPRHDPAEMARAVIRLAHSPTLRAHVSRKARLRAAGFQFDPFAMALFTQVWRAAHPG